MSQEITHCTRLPKRNKMFQISRAKSSRKRLRTRSHYAGKYRRRSKDNFSWNENTVLFIDTKTSVLLQTAKIFVSRADDPNHRIQARLIFDTGSQRSYVSTRLRNALQLPTINQETLMIKTFGSETGQIHSSDLVQLCGQGMTSETYLYVIA